MSRSVYRYNVSLCYLCVSLTVSVVSVKRQEVTETAKSVTETSRSYRNFTMAVLYEKEKSVINNHIFHNTIRCAVSVNEDNEKLPTFYWLPQLHKRPCKTRLIANSS